MREISFNELFYKSKPKRMLKGIQADTLELSKQSNTLLEDIFGQFEFISTLIIAIE